MGVWPWLSLTSGWQGCQPIQQKQIPYSAVVILLLLNISWLWHTGKLVLPASNQIQHYLLSHHAKFTLLMCYKAVMLVCSLPVNQPEMRNPILCFFFSQLQALGSWFTPTRFPPAVIGVPVALLWSLTSLPILTFDPWLQLNNLHHSIFFFFFAFWDCSLQIPEMGVMLWELQWINRSLWNTQANNHVHHGQKSLRRPLSPSLMSGLNFSKSSLPRVHLIYIKQAELLPCDWLSKQRNIVPNEVAIVCTLYACCFGQATYKTHFQFVKFKHVSNK